uniref:Sec-independent protein translocase component tatC n=1 Tax=Didymosphenia geminata TaxID=1115533 RepID=A0A1L4BME3_9STRA|nr:Sec-independent protein translocase component tatC [Didymosphenia geminata]API83119.1 Sec-independent protein translocase component tatC [Didymosphenia geminata]
MLKFFIEIKNRFFLIFMTLVSLFVTIYFYKEVLLFIIIKPNSFYNIIKTVPYYIFTDITDILFIYIELEIFVCSQVLLIILIYHSFIFFSDSLFINEYRFCKSLFKTIIISWIIASFFSVNYAIPLSWNFFFSFQELLIEKNLINFYFEAKITEYLKFYTSLYFIFWLYSQILAFFFFFLYNSKKKNIKKLRKIFYFFFFLLSTLATPDVINQLLSSIFFILTYEFFFLLILCKTNIIFLYNKIKVTN